MKPVIILLSLLGSKVAGACSLQPTVLRQISTLDAVLNSETYGKQIQAFIEKYPEEKILSMGYPNGATVRMRMSNNCYITSEVFFKKSDRIGNCSQLDRVESKTQCAGPNAGGD